MKFTWSKDHKSVILIAETKAEVAFCEIFVVDLNAHKYASSKNEARWTIVPEEIKE